MALTLDAAIAAAQNNASRHPLVEIISQQRIADIPFDGSFLTAETYNEFGPNTIAHSSGRLLTAYCYGPDANNKSGIKFVYTDIGRAEYTTSTIVITSSLLTVMLSVSLCELTNGNICLTYLCTNGGKYYLSSRIVTYEGVDVAGTVVAIGNWNMTSFTSHPWVQTIAANSYLMVYGKQSGSDYYIYKRTSADCLAWSAESALTIGGLTSTWKLQNPSIIKEVTSGNLWLWFDAQEATSPGGDPLTNVCYSISTDGGSTWANAVKITGYTTYSEIGGHPIAVQKAANQMHLLYTRTVGALHMTETEPGWPTGDAAYALSWDSVNRKVYVSNYTAINGPLLNVTRVDVDTWTADKFWDTTTTPAFSGVTAGGASNLNRNCGVKSDGHHVIAFHNDSGAARFLSHLDGSSDTIVNYNLKQTGGNVSGIPCGDTYYLAFAQMDAANNKIWLCFLNSSASPATGYVGYLDTTEPSSYAYHAVVADTSMTNSERSQLTPYYRASMTVDVANGQIYLISGVPYGSSQDCVCIIYDISTGARVNTFTLHDSVGTHFGIPHALIYNGKAYGGKTYGYSYISNVFIELDLTTGEETELLPTYVDGTIHTDVPFSGPCYLQDDKIAFIHYPYGIAIFDTVYRTWVLHSNDTIPGLTVNDDPKPHSQIVFDDTNDMIIFGQNEGIVMFSINGFIHQTYFSIGTYSGGAWTFPAAASMMQGYNDYEACAVVEPGSSTAMFVFWTNLDTSANYSIKWDKDGSAMDISSKIVGEVVTEQGISGNAATLSFTVSHGHLFDPYNTQSVLNSVLKKGRELTLRWGEKISGTDYWQAAGKFYISEASMYFQRGHYPVMEVKAEDQRSMWQHSHISATEYFSNKTKKYIVDTILEDHAGMATADINTPVMGTGSLVHQWMETSIMEIINQVCERAGFYFRFDFEGKAHAKLITNSGAIDHTYADVTKLLKYTPDDKYSCFTNKVVVKGQELTFTVVTYPEERMGDISGTLGWWGCKADHLFWFSDDQSRICVNPRLVVLESATSIALNLAGGVSEYLVPATTGDKANKYCIIFVEAPSLVAALIAGIAMYLIGAVIPDIVVTVGFIANGGITIRVGTFVQSLSMIVILNILGSVANYQMEVWAQPQGQIRQSIQGQANDTDHQYEINAVIEQVIDDPLCYTLADCNEVAAHELMVVQMQRRRLMIEKIAHLQDEDGDTIRVVHPYSGQNLDIFIAGLTRRFKKAEAEDGDGYFLDEITGWVVS